MATYVQVYVDKLQKILVHFGFALVTFPIVEYFDNSNYIV
jgi:hypothetical protein